MRLVVALLASLIIFGSVAGFTWMTSIPPASRFEGDYETKAKGFFSLQLTLTFHAEADVFSLEPTSVLIQFRGQDLLKLEEPVMPGSPITIEKISGIVQGKNEFYVQVTPRDDEAAVARAVRLRIFRDGEEVSSETLWSEPGQPVAGPIRLDVARVSQMQETDKHDH